MSPKAPPKAPKAPKRNAANDQVSSQIEEPINIESTMNSTQVVNENMLSEVELRLADLIDQRVSAIEVKLCSEYENKMAEITTAYNRKIEDLELKLSTAITS